MSITSIAAKVLLATVLNNNTKIVILFVSTWIFVTLLSSMDIRQRTEWSSPPPPMYYYTSLKKDHMTRKLQKAVSNKIEIDTSFLEEVDSTENSDDDIFYDTKNGSMLCFYYISM